MGTGYTRNDTANNIADGNVINASDLDGEFDAIQSAFNGSSGHSHDGTTGEGPKIGTAGIVDANITTAKLADDAVTPAKLQDSGTFQVGQMNAGGNGSTAGTTIKDAKIEVRSGSGAVPAIDLYCESNNAHKVTIKSPPHSAYSGDVTFQLPSSNGTNGQFLQTDGSGNLSYATVGNATTSTAGLMSASDKTKMDGIESGATADQTITAGSGLSGGGTGNVTISHADTSSQSSSNNSGRTYIQDITLDTYGHVTGIATATETVVNTDTNTTYTANGNYGLTLSGTEFRLENDRRRAANDEDVYSGNTHDYTFYDASVGIRWYTAGAEDMRLENDGDLHVDGNITAYSTTISDPRLKEDIQPVTDALAKIEKLNGYTFTYRHDGSASAGVVSTEVADVLPSAIRKSKVPLVAGHDNEIEYDIVQYDQLHALLIEAVKELSARVEELENGTTG